MESIYPENIKRVFTHSIELKLYSLKNKCKMAKISHIILYFQLTCLFNLALSQDLADQELIQEIDALVQRNMLEGDIPGLSLVIISNEKEVIKSFGYKDLKETTPITPYTLFELGSCSKAFTALAITKLVQEQKLKYDDKVSSYIPWFKVQYEGKKVEIRINQLLHHTSGIPWYTISKIPPSNSPDALEETVRILIDQELNHLPGKAYEYATINYDVLALIIQELTGKPFEGYMRELFKDLGLKHTSIGQPKDSVFTTPGYKIGFFKPRRYDAPIFKGNNAAGYVISNAIDMATWLKLQLGLEGDVMLESIKNNHLRDKTVAPHGLSSYAKGWEVSLEGDGEIYHTGFNPNFSSYIAFRPESSLGVVVLANSNSNYAVSIGERIIKRLSQEKIEKEIDPGDQNDKAYSTASIVLMVYCFLIISFFIWICVGIVKKNRQFETPTLSKFIKFAYSLLMIIPYLFGIYLLPKAIANFSWEAIEIWAPSSFMIMVQLLLFAIGMTYFVYLISLIYPEPNPYKRIAPRVLLLSILSGFANVVLIIVVTSAVQVDKGFWYIIFYYVLILAVYLLGRRFVQVNLIKVTQGLIYDLRIQVIDKIFSTSYQNFEKVDRGRVFTSLNDDVNTIGQSTNTFITLLTSIVTAIGAFLYLASLASWATFFTIIILVSLAYLYFSVSSRTEKYFVAARDSQDIFMGLVNGLIGGFMELSLQRKKKQAYKGDISISTNDYKDKVSIANIKFVNAFLIGESFLVVILGFVAFGMDKIFSNIEFHTVMSFIIIFLYLIGPINGILGSIPMLVELKVAWNRINDFIKEIPANQPVLDKPIYRFSQVERIKAEGLTFQYEGKEHNFSVGPIDLEILKGEVLFIVGGNGSGKTTLGKLITGLYSVKEGQLLINDKPVDPAEIGEYYSAVLNPFYLFEKLYGVDLTKREEEIEGYLKLMNLEDKVQIQENEFSTIGLSGGQKKRLALLRCYLEDAPIFLFDEWAADQDPEYRQVFYRKLLPEMKQLGKIVIAITHDDHYFDVADKIIKMNNGKIEPYVQTDLRKIVNS